MTRSMTRSGSKLQSEPLHIDLPGMDISGKPDRQAIANSLLITSVIHAIAQPKLVEWSRASRDTMRRENRPRVRRARPPCSSVALRLITIRSIVHSINCHAWHFFNLWLMEYSINHATFEVDQHYQWFVRCVMRLIPSFILSQMILTKSFKHFSNNTSQIWVATVRCTVWRTMTFFIWLLYLNTEELSLQGRTACWRITFMDVQ